MFASKERNSMFFKEVEKEEENNRLFVEYIYKSHEWQKKDQREREKEKQCLLPL